MPRMPGNAWLCRNAAGLLSCVRSHFRTLRIYLCMIVYAAAAMICDVCAKHTLLLVCICLYQFVLVYRSVYSVSIFFGMCCSFCVCMGWCGEGTGRKITIVTLLPNMQTYMRNTHAATHKRAIDFERAPQSTCIFYKW